MSNVVDKRDEFILKLARNLLEAEPETKRQVVRVYDNLTQRDIYEAIVKLQELSKRKKT